MASSWRCPWLRLLPRSAEHGLVAVRQAVDEGVGVGQAGGGDHLLVAGLQAAVADVVHHGVGEQEVVLQHQAQLAAQVVLLHLRARPGRRCWIAPLSTS